MQDRLTHWQNRTRAAASADRAPQPDRAAEPAPPSAVNPVLTGVLLTAGTLCAAGTFAWMLPTTGRTTSLDGAYSVPPAREPVVQVEPIAVSPVVAEPANPAPPTEPTPAQPRAAAPLIPSVLASLAVRAAEPFEAVDWDEFHAAAAEMRVAAAVEPEDSPIAVAPIPPQTATPPVRPLPASTEPRGDRVVYLVDASGSLLDSMPQVIDWLGDSLDTLDKHQEFTVLFFRRGEVFEVPPVGMKPASFAAKAQAYGWMHPESGNVIPKGRSDIAAAMEAAMKYHADELFILSDDAFARRSEATWNEDSPILAEIARTVNNEPLRIHTVQFFYRDDAGALEAIADCFNGTYTFVKPTDEDATATSDSFLELTLN